MANFIVTYDLNGPHPTHAEMDAHLNSLGAAFVTDRLLETVWYVAGPATAESLREYVASILRPEDLLLVVEAEGAAWTRLLVDPDAFAYCFAKAA